MNNESQKYKVIKTFKNIDGAVYFPGDVVELGRQRALVLKSNYVIGGVLASQSKGIFETAEKKQFEQATKKESQNSTSKKTYENRKK